MRTGSSVPRGFIIFAQIFGTIVSIIGLAFYIYFLDTIINNVNDTNTENYAQTKAIFTIILGVIVYFTIKSLINCIAIIDTMSKMDDLTLSANKWIISALSLSVGGFFTPFLISSFPNVNIKSTISPKVFLSKVVGVTMLIGGAAFLLIYGLYMGNDLKDEEVKGLSSAMFAIGGIITGLGVIATALFYRSNSEKQFNGDTAMRPFMRIIAGIIIFIVTLELIIVMIEALLRLLQAFANFMKSMQDGGILRMIFAFLNLGLTFAYVGFVMYITGKTIGGIWKDEVDFAVYEPMQNVEQQNA